jgi:hypothetical protein
MTQDPLTQRHRTLAPCYPRRRLPVLAFIEDNWLGRQRTGGSSFDNLAGSLDGMFSWDHPSFAPYLLGPATGEPAR